MNTTCIAPPLSGSGPSVYSSGVLCEGHASTLYVAGQVGADAAGQAREGIEAQCRQAWANIEAILAQAGMGLQDIVKTTVYLTDPSDYADFVRVRSEVLGEHKPASTLVCVSSLLMPEWKVEIDAIASR